MSSCKCGEAFGGNGLKMGCAGKAVVDFGNEIRSLQPPTQSNKVRPRSSFLLVIRLPDQPIFHINVHLRDKVMRRVISLEYNRLTAESQLTFVISYSLGWIELVARPGEVENCGLSRLIAFAGCPITGYAATNPYYPA